MPAVDGISLATSNYIETKHYYSNELDLSSRSDNALQWIFGLYQYHESNYQTPGNIYLSGQTQLATPFNINFTGLAAPNPHNGHLRSTAGNERKFLRRLRAD